MNRPGREHIRILRREAQRENFFFVFRQLYVFVIELRFN